MSLLAEGSVAIPIDTRIVRFPEGVIEGGETATRHLRQGADLADFCGYVMAEWPEVRTTEFNEKFRGLSWNGEGDEPHAWQQGQTGYPIVDASSAS